MAYSVLTDKERLQDISYRYLISTGCPDEEAREIVDNFDRIIEYRDGEPFVMLHKDGTKSFIPKGILKRG